MFRGRASRGQAKELGCGDGRLKTAVWAYRRKRVEESMNSTSHPNPELQDTSYSFILLQGRCILAAVTYLTFSQLQLRAHGN